MQNLARPNPQERARARRLLVRYGITVAEYDGLLKNQGGVCAVCGRPPKKIRLAVDHDHKGSGRRSVRGLLCGMCNRKIVGVIERFKVAPERIVAYLRAERPFSNKQSRGLAEPELLARYADYGNVGLNDNERHALTGAVDGKDAPYFTRYCDAAGGVTIPPVAVVAAATAPIEGDALDRVRER